MTEHYPELEQDIEKIDRAAMMKNQEAHIKRTELKIMLEVAEQLRRIADRFPKMV